MDRLYIPIIILHLSIVAKQKIILQGSHNNGVWNYWQQTPLLHMLYYMDWLTQEFWTRTGGWEFDRSHGTGTSSPSHWPRNLWVRWCVSSWRPLFPSRSSVLIYICIFYMSSVFFNFTSCVLLSDDNSLTPGCLWLLAFVLNNTLILGILCSTISHLPGCFFVPGLSFRISDSTRCHQTPLCHIWLLNLDILNGSFRLCNWLSLRRLVSWINHLPPACWSTFWKSILGL